MKHIIFVFIVFLLCTLSSCIPSLHGIFTDESRAVEDKILGSWTMPNEPLILTGHINIESDEGDESEAQALAELEKHLSGSDKTTLWVFERAANITFESHDGSSSIAFNPGTLSMAPSGMHLKRREDLPYYFLTHQEFTGGDTVTTRLLVNLTYIKEHLYMDFLPRPLKAKELSGRFASNYLYTHTFAKCTFEGGSLVIHPFDGEYIQTLIEQKRIRLKHEIIGDEEDIILTASTEELRAFIEKYGNDPELYDDQERLTKYLDHK